MPEDQDQSPVEFLDLPVSSADPALEIRERFGAVAMNVKGIIPLPIFLHHGAALHGSCITAKAGRKKSKLLDVPLLMLSLREQLHGQLGGLPRPRIRRENDQSWDHRDRRADLQRLPTTLFRQRDESRIAARQPGICFTLAVSNEPDFLHASLPVVITFIAKSHQQIPRHILEQLLMLFS